MLFQSIVYGPIHSRRLGISLGINLMPTDAKLCTFNCIYCECGWNTNTDTPPHIPGRIEIATELEQKLQQLKAEKTTPDVITFSGNGEPTLHQDFYDIMCDTVKLRNTYCPSAKISVLSNSTQLFRPEVRKALMLADNRILKLDSAITDTMRKIDQPINHELTVEKITDYLCLFKGKFTLQTCFLKGQLQDGSPIDNTTEKEIEAWLNILTIIHPKDIMIYVIDRQTPLPTLQKISPDIMEMIALKARHLGFKVIVSA